jgi:hypothetical protein
MKQSITRICTVVYVVGLIFSFGILSTPPGLLPIYFGLLVFAAVPLCIGSQKYRFFGSIAVAVTVILCVLEYSRCSIQELSGRTSANVARATKH